MTKRASTSSRATLVGDALVAMMVAAGSLVRDLDAACQGHGITHDQYNVLRILRGVYPEGHPRGEISARLISRAPDVTRMLDRLVQRNLVQRDWHPDNRRLSIAKITSKGLELLRDVDQSIVAEHSRYTDGVADEDLSVLRRICQRMTP